MMHQEFMQVAQGSPEITMLANRQMWPLLTETPLIQANPSAALFPDQQNFTFTMEGCNMTLSIRNTNPKLEYGIFDPDSMEDVQYGDWIGGTGSKIDFNGLNPNMTYAIRMRLAMPPAGALNGPMLAGVAGDPVDPSQEIHYSEVLPLLSDTDVAFVAGFDNLTGCGSVKIIPLPGCKYTIVNTDDPKMPPLNAMQRKIWGIQVMGSDGKMIEPDADGYWSAPMGVEWLRMIVPAGGVYRFGGVNSEGTVFVSRGVAIVQSVDKNWSVEYVKQPTRMTRRIVVDPACRSSLYSARWGKFAEKKQYRLPPGSTTTRLYIPLDFITTGHLGVSAIPFPLDGSVEPPM